MTCPTTSGRYQCRLPRGHEGECEADDAPPSRQLGPFPDALRARAYLRGRLDASAAQELDGIGRLLAIHRRPGEPDRAYRERLWAESRPSS